ncbi:calcium-binding protein KIC-like [Nymphaea colorata]|uniref:calcium-binding protein KIC-like n=1 Tax=Nymphaea colorata TaxID=210225 RepID=UPI00129ECF60|nr:calcium-binding protein KIC-like [Nymphaea colorata]
MVQDFEDFLPRLAEKLGAEGLMSELCNGFRMLMDPTTMLITCDSLKRNAAALGLTGMSDEEAAAMVRVGDLDGDGALNQMEFCVLMVRLSPGLMERSWSFLQESLSSRSDQFQK